MTDFKPTIDPAGRSPKDWIQVEKIEKDKQTREETSKREGEKKKPELFLLAGFTVFVKKLLIFLSMNRSKVTSVFIDSIEGLIPYLHDLKKALQLLATEDVSHDSDYVQKLSDTWYNLIEGLATLDWWEKKRNEKRNRVKKILETMRLYPPQEQHTFGFYLSKHAGKEWLPFPLMDLLFSLHEDYQALKEKSVLGKWIAEVESIIKVEA